MTSVRAIAGCLPAMALMAAAAGLTVVLAPTESEPASFEQQVTFNRDIQRSHALVSCLRGCRNREI